MALTWQVIAFEPYFKSAKNVRSNSRAPQRWVSLFLYLVHFTLTKKWPWVMIIIWSEIKTLVSKGVSSANYVDCWDGFRISTEGKTIRHEVNCDEIIIKLLKNSFEIQVDNTCCTVYHPHWLKKIKDISSRASSTLS
jgi:hypothetical protein